MPERVKVIITNKQRSIKVPTHTRLLIRRCCNAVLQMENFEGSAEISVTFVDNEQIKEYNAKYRNNDSITDVLSFPMGENNQYDVNPETGAKILGDIVISLEKAVDQADLFGHSFRREVAYLTAHSVLHLLGYDHMEPLEKVRMREKEEYVMDLLGLSTTNNYNMSE